MNNFIFEQIEGNKFYTSVWIAILFGFPGLEILSRPSFWTLNFTSVPNRAHKQQVRKTKCAPNEETTGNNVL